MLLLFKRFVWVMKFKTCILDLNAFKNFVRVHITDLKYMFDIKGEENNFSEWNTLYSALGA